MVATGPGLWAYGVEFCRFGFWVWVLGFRALSPPLTPADPLEARCK